MTIKSMTGFARMEGHHASWSWHWEARSVNGRGLDVRLRLPNGLDALEIPARQCAARHVARGNISLTLTLRRSPAAGGHARVNEAVLADVLAAAERIRAQTGSPPPDAAALLGLRGVLELDEGEEGAQLPADLMDALLGSVEVTMQRLVEMRAEEGSRLSLLLEGQLQEMRRLIAAIAASPARRAEAIARRIEEQVARLTAASSGLDRDRLHQEAILLATRADIEEEIGRCGAHLDALAGHLSAREPVGRKLDFLTQELNREANTICSKSNDVEITRLGLDLKAVIDQMREQVQNIE